MQGVALGVLLALGFVTVASAQSFDDVRWQYRPLLVFAPPGSEARVRQLDLLTADEALVRDLRLAVYLIEPRRIEARLGAPKIGTDAATLRRRFGVPAGAFRAVLVGLDGSAKLTAREPIALERLEATINAMPMRRRELRQRSPAG
ncbi:DUF4174 domain-containing protein [Acuticoccus sp.]|uniref:DUF4174 domain-containing protein n=1 Tax=Acuticoccus sp. TaxID=1904378 RepID=UPI003B51C27C